MFTEVKSTYNEKNDTWTFRANFGIGFKSYMDNYVLGKKKTMLLFRSISFSEITVDSFFLLELSLIAGLIVDGETKYSSWVNHKTLKSLIAVILRDTWLNPNTYNGLSKFELNTKKITEVMTTEPLEFQLKFYEKYELVKNILGYNGILTDAATGVGKALSLDTPIKIPSGWKTMRDVSMGDKLISQDGSITIVTGVYPQGVLDLYTITFADGRNVDCCLDHLWKVYPDKINEDAEVLKTEVILNRLKNGSSLYIDLINDKDNKAKLINNIFKLLDLEPDSQNSIVLKRDSIDEDKLKLLKEATYASGSKLIINDSSIIVDFINNRLKIESIKYSKKGEAQCISVDHPSKLFVIKDYIVTHNTYMGLSMAEALESDYVIIIAMKANMETIWLDTLTNSDKKDYFYKKKINRGDVFLSLDAYKNIRYNGQRYVLFNYEALDRLYEVLPYIKHKKTTILIDEAHNFTSLNSNRKNSLVRFCKESNSKDIVLLSGTPIKSSTLDMMPYLELIDPKFNTVVASRFKKIYSAPNYIFKMVVPIRYGMFSVKIEKEVLNLAPIEYSTILIPIKDGEKYTLANIKIDMQNYVTNRIKELEDNISAYKEEYDKLLSKAKLASNLSPQAWMEYYNNFKLVNDYYQKRQLMFHGDLIKDVNDFEKVIILPLLKGDEKNKFREASVVLKYPMLKVRGEVLGRIVLGARVACHRDMAAALNYDILDSTTAKSIILSSYTEVCDAAYNACKKNGYTPVQIYGDENKNRATNILNFIEDTTTNPAIGTYQSLSTGHHLVVANLVILLDLPFRTYTLDQAIARVYRKGQTEIVHVLYTKLDTGEDYNINSRNIDILKWAKDVVEEVTGNSINGLDFDKGKEISSNISSGLENDVEGDWEFTESSLLLSSNFMDWLAGLEGDTSSLVALESSLANDKIDLEKYKNNKLLGW